MALLDELLAPLGRAAFFAEHWESRFAHLRGEPERGTRLCTHAALRAALATNTIPPDGLVAFPEQHRPGLTLDALFAEPALLDGYLDAGHPLVWNQARGVFPEVDALAAGLAEALGAQVWPNVYATGTAGTPFGVHFDGHEVLAVQCAGRKRWWLSEVRVDRPLDTGAMEAAVRHTQRTRREEALSRPLAELIAEPGDVVYVPRGQFHDAHAEGGRSLHVTFGVRLPTGFDALEALLGEALADPVLREYLIPEAADPTGERGAAEVSRIAERLRTLTTTATVADALEKLRRAFVERSRPPRS
jgi:lysine-specific demethylase/histidyl-hydroxylase NO66